MKGVESIIKEKTNPRKAPGYGLLVFFLLKQSPIKSRKFRSLEHLLHLFLIQGDFFPEEFL